MLILGPSGSGEIRLISVLAGIIPEHVEADMQGEVVLQRHTGVMFQDPDSQFCMHRVNEEIAFSLRTVPSLVKRWMTSFSSSCKKSN
ncbi:hypothetical protein BSAF29S_03002 [Bacillus safensis subsp. safensis]